jgi:hypothetical protein
MEYKIVILGDNLYVTHGEVNISDISEDVITFRENIDGINIIRREKIVFKEGLSSLGLEKIVSK